MWSKWKYRLLKRFWFLALPIWRRRNIWLRVFLCWTVGLVALTFDELKSFDTRLSLRGQNGFVPDIVIIKITPEDRKKFLQKNNYLQFSDNHLPDNLYWNEKTWVNILNLLLEQKPTAIAVTFFFGDNIPKTSLSQEQEKIFTHPTVIWNTYLNRRAQTLPPRFSNEYGDNIGIGDLQADDDGILRHFSSPLIGIPHIAARISEKIDPRPSIEYVFPTSRLINFRGATNSFSEVSLSQVLLKKLSPDFFKNKLVIIGSGTAPGHQFLTPLGLMNRAEIIAHITDNILHRRWIEHLDYEWYILYLFFLLIVSLIIMRRYPSQSTIVFITALFICCLGLSIWLFDAYYFWVPIMSPLIQLSFTWMIFMGLQASIIERKNWRLKREQLYLRKVEELKSNFVSLISHDLKTPIAKIQAVTDRLITENNEYDFSQDLKSIRNYSEELHRYIESILKVIKVESKDFKINLQIAEINETIEAAIEKLSPLAKEKYLNLTVELEPMFSIEFDVTLIQEVIINLIENSIKYTPKGGSITISSKEIKGKIVVEVADTGTGITQEEQKNIWNKFVRGKEQDLKTKGSGLGLYLVKYFVELHGGQVSLKSTHNKGTKIGFWLPAESDIDIEVPSNVEDDEIL